MAGDDGGPFVKAGSGVVVSTTILKLCVSVPSVLLAVTSPVKVPTAVGVPVMAPLLSSVKPSGKAPEVTLKVGAGEPLAV